MELWVRSQNKEELVRVDNVRIKNEYEQKKVNDIYGRTYAYIKGKYKCSYIYADSTWLGEYKSKERALEVLDEIQNLMLCNKDAKYSGDASINELANCYLYEMPEE